MFSLLPGSSSPAGSGHLSVKWRPVVAIAPSTPPSSTAAYQPSVLDLLAAPTVFLELCLVYASCLQPQLMRAAAQQVVDRCPAISFRLTTTTGGRLSLVARLPGADGAGLAFMEGAAAGLSLQQAQPHPAPTSGEEPLLPEDDDRRPTPWATPELTSALFGHLPGALTPAYVDQPDAALVHLALVQLADRGCVLGLRMSHLLGDWTSLRALLQQLTREYSAAAAACAAQPRPCAPPRPAGSPAPGPAAPPPGEQQQQQQQGALPPAAPLLNQLVAAARRSLPPGFEPVRLKPQGPQEQRMLQQLAALGSSGGGGGGGAGDDDAADADAQQGPLRLTYHATPALIQRLKRRALREGGGAPQQAAPHGPSPHDGCDGDAAAAAAAAAPPSTHNVLVAHVARCFCGLPGRLGVSHDVSVAVDMRRRLPPQHLRHLPPPQQRLLPAAFGNFFASAVVEAARPQQITAGALAGAVAAAVHRSAELWLPDLAWASAALGLSQEDLAAGSAAGAASPPPPPPPPATQRDAAAAQGLAAAATPTPSRRQGADDAFEAPHGPDDAADAQHDEARGGGVTWRRLHAMGPRRCLTQQLALGCLASLSTTQWPLVYASDAAVAGGELPLAAVPSFSRPQPYPLLLMQHAAPAQGGGVLLHLWVDAAEAGPLQRAIADAAAS